MIGQLRPYADPLPLVTSLNQGIGAKCSFQLRSLIKITSGGDNPLKRLVELAIHPVEFSKNNHLLTGLLQMSFELPCSRSRIIILVGEGGRGTPRPSS
jgi:hypothetical protein